MEEGDDEFRIAIDTCSSRFFYQGLTCFLRDSVDRNIGIHFPPYQRICFFVHLRTHPSDLRSSSITPFQFQPKSLSQAAQHRHQVVGNHISNGTCLL